MGMVGKSRNDDGSIRQKLQYSYFPKISEKYFGKNSYLQK